MRIEGTPRPVKVANRRSSSAGQSGGAFTVDDGASASSTTSVSAPMPTSSIGSLLALQAVEDPLFAKRKKVKRGQSILEALEEIKLDLLAGQVSEVGLNRLMTLIQQAKESVDPQLDALIEDIELRARVELAKLGKYPNI